jgi:K+-sensing histidine kinase KdpD
VQIHSRRDLLVGVITNILTNARTHAPRARIWITACPIGYDATLGQSAVRIQIADDGPGIPPEQRQAVLLPGVRGSAAANTPGHGLGLASAVQALSEVGGTLRLSEREGGGTVVTVTIPTAAPRRADMGFVDGARTVDAGAPAPSRAVAATPGDGRTTTTSSPTSAAPFPHQTLPHQTVLR